MKKRQISRKDFLKQSFTGLTGLFAYNILEKSPLKASNKQDVKRAARTLGRTGISVSALGMGASRVMEPSLLLAAVDRGITFIDTGRSYFSGQNEVMIGKALKGIRKKVVIQSKMRVRPGQTGQTAAAIRDTMAASLNASLDALQTDYIDIMLIHGAADESVLANETVMEFLSAAKKRGQIRAHGFSSHANETELLKWTNRTTFYDVVMVPFNHKGSFVHMNSGRYREWDQPALASELEKAHKNNLGIIAMKTCSAGPYSANKEEKPSYREALGWVLKHDYIHTAAAAMTSFSQVEENARVIL